MPTNSRNDLPLAVGLIVLLLGTLALLWPGIHGPFLFDDLPNLSNLEHLNARFTRQSIGVYLALFEGVPGRPLSALSFLLNDFAWPSDAQGFKYTNLLIHLLNGVLVFGLARTIARAAYVRQADVAALLASALWLLNPIQVSAVFLTVQRMTELAGLFVFAGLWGYVALARRARTALTGLAAVGVLGFATVLALLCKESGALAPLLAAILNATVLRKIYDARPTIVRRIATWLPWAAVAGLLMVLATQFASQLSYYAVRDFTLGERLLTQARVLMDYLGLIFIPRMSSSGLYNDDYAVSHGLLSPLTTLPSLLVIAGLIASALWLRKRQPWYALAVLWFFGGHLLESTVFPLELYFEHRNYVPLFGPCLAIASAVIALKTERARRIAIAGTLAWLALAAGIMHLQAGVWGSWAKLSTIWRLENPKSLRAQQQYADFLFRTGNQQEAYEVFEASLASGIAPGSSHLQLIVLDCMAHRSVAESRIVEAEKLLATSNVDQGTAGILQSLRESIELGECKAEIPPARWLHLTQLALDNPTAGGIQRMLRVERANLFINMRHIPDAANELEHAWKIYPEPRVAFYAAAILASNGYYDDARDWARRPLMHKGSRWKAWLSMTDAQAQDLLRAIDENDPNRGKVPVSAADDDDR